MARDMSESLTKTARDAFENPLIYVYLSGGVYWLAIRKSIYTEVGKRTLRAIMPQTSPIRDAIKEVRRIAQEY